MCGSPCCSNVSLIHFDFMSHWLALSACVMIFNCFLAIVLLFSSDIIFFQDVTTIDEKKMIHGKVQEKMSGNISH